MSSFPDSDADVHFGAVGNDLPDWRGGPLDDDEDPDDEELDATPEDVIQVLGFDPLELDEDAD